MGDDGPKTPNENVLEDLLNSALEDRKVRENILKDIRQNKQKQYISLACLAALPSVFISAVGAISYLLTKEAYVTTALTVGLSAVASILRGPSYIELVVRTIGDIKESDKSIRYYTSLLQ